MKSLFFFLVLSLVVASFRVFSFLSFDEQMISQQVVPAAAARFVDRSPEDLDLLKERLNLLQSLPEDFFLGLDVSDFGRKTLFLPDTKKKKLGSPSPSSS